LDITTPGLTSTAICNTGDSSTGGGYLINGAATVLTSSSDNTGIN
jgi:hypothetical protein